MTRMHPILLALVLFFAATPALATNGDNLIGIGPVARSMGGVGIAAPQDAISAVFANPAAMCFGPYCPSSEVNFAGTAFMPHVDAEIENSGGTFKVDSEEKVYPIPALGISSPITEAPPFWRFGFAAYGVTGLGVDYRDTAIDNATFYDFGAMGQFPMASGTYTDLSILKFAPSIAVQPFDKISFGLAAHIDYGSLDLQSGTSSGYALGLQAGMIYHVLDSVALGLNYVTPQEVTHENVSDFDGDGELDDLDLESPQQLGFGVAWNMGQMLLIEGDVKWVNWSDAAGYEDFDWDDQWVFAIGTQYRPIPQLALRAGYNYAESPVNEHDDFNGTENVSIQGKTLPAYYYETFRVIGFPAVVEHHLTFGAGWQFTDTFSLDASYMYGFANEIEQEGTDITGQPVRLKSELSEESASLGLTWRF